MQVPTRPWSFIDLCPSLTPSHSPSSHFPRRRRLQRLSSPPPCLHHRRNPNPHNAALRHLAPRSEPAPPASEKTHRPRIRQLLVYCHRSRRRALYPEAAMERQGEPGGRQRAEGAEDFVRQAARGRGVAPAATGGGTRRRAPGKISCRPRGT